MKTIEKYEKRVEMVKMHDEYINRMKESIKNEEYVEAVWFCYAIFEQRITRLILKHISCCPKKIKKEGKPAAITTRINCIKQLISNKYSSYELLDIKLLDEILTWCKTRNTLVHELISLEHYKKYDEEFKKLALEGEPLVLKLYEQITQFRKMWYKEESPKYFPSIKCKCEYRCIYKE